MRFAGMIIFSASVFLASLLDDVSKQVALLVVGVVVEVLREIRSRIYRKKVRNLENAIEKK